MGILLGLTAALAWGIADFFATRVSRAAGALRSLLWTQLAGLALMLLLMLARRESVVSAPAAWSEAVGLGVLHLLGCIALYRAFEIGTLALVSPIASSYAVFTALLSFANGERLSLLALLGAALLMVGIILVTGGSPPPTSGMNTIDKRAGLPHAFAASLLFGFVFWRVDHVADALGRVWPLVCLRVVAVVGLVLFFALKLDSSMTPSGEREQGLSTAQLLRLVLGVGFADVVAWLSFSFAQSTGFITIVTALSSLFGGVTVLLAWAFLHER
ncbi:MAG TPA: EamA family transporter, partial [Abditibacteriaceae bacterium]